jgi:hypothetical protein
MLCRRGLRAHLHFCASFQRAKGCYSFRMLLSPHWLQRNAPHKQVRRAISPNSRGRKFGATCSKFIGNLSAHLAANGIEEHAHRCGNKCQPGIDARGQ